MTMRKGTAPERAEWMSEKREAYFFFFGINMRRNVF